MVSARTTRTPKRPPSSRPFGRFLLHVEQLETRNVFATSVLPSSAQLSQPLATPATVRVAVQVVQAPVFVNNAAVTTPASVPASFDVPSAVRSIAGNAFSQTDGAVAVRVVVVVNLPTGPVSEVLTAPSPFTAAAAATADQQLPAPPSPAPPLPPSVVVPDPLVNFPHSLWVADQPPAPRPSNYSETAEEVPVPPANDGQVPPQVNPAPALPPLPPAITVPIPLGMLDHSEPRVAVVLADKQSAEPMEQRLEAPILPPTFEETTSPSSAVAGVAVALVGAPCAVAVERQRREYYRDRLRDQWPWVG